MSPTRLPRLLAAPLALAAGLTLARRAHAGPTVAADLALGTSVGETGDQYLVGPHDDRPALYAVGVRIRGGWRFDLGPVWIVPEIGAGYDALRHYTYAHHVPRVFGGGRAGVSVPLAPLVAFEPGIYGHVGYAHVDIPDQPDHAAAADVGLLVDVRFLRRIIVGVQLGYEVVTTWEIGVSGGPGGLGPTCFGNPQPATTFTAAYAYKWIGYGLHAGVLFW